MGQQSTSNAYVGEGVWVLMQGVVVLVLALVFQFLIAATAWSGDVKPKYGPKNAPRATPLAQSNEYFRAKKNAAPDFWSLIGFYVPQLNEYSCSAASVVMVLNAARVGLPKTADDTVVTQKTMLEKVTADEWSQRLSKEGVNGEHGTNLDRLGRVVEAAFKAYGFKNVTVKVVRVDSTSSETKAELRKVLAQNEKSNKDFVIANFNQQVFTGDADAGHIAPVGAYDAARGRVLVLDPDRDYYEPYWVSVDTLLAGMATKDKSASANRGYVVVNVGQ